MGQHFGVNGDGSFPSGEDVWGRNCECLGTVHPHNVSTKVTKNHARHWPWCESSKLHSGGDVNDKANGSVDRTPTSMTLMPERGSFAFDEVVMFERVCS